MAFVAPLGSPAPMQLSAARPTVVAPVLEGPPRSSAPRAREPGWPSRCVLASALAALGVRPVRRRAAAGRRTRSSARAADGLRPLPNLPHRTTPVELSPLRFAKHANWVAPGHLLVGRYPLTAPSEQDGRTLIRRLMTEARVSTFVCFQQEVPPQTEPARWPAGGVKLHGRRCLPYAGLARQFATGRKLHFLHHSMQDLEAPDLGQLREVVDDLHERAMNEEVLYLHCWGGRGRSATVAACLLARLYNISGDEALARVQHGYDSRDYDNCASPETERQRQLTLDFCG